MQSEPHAKHDPGIVDRVQANMLAYFLLFRGLPNMIVGEGDVTWFVNNDGAPGNHILHTNITSPDPDERIDSAIAQLGQITDHIDWLVFPGCRPVDLGRRLEARGMPGGPGGTWMLADLSTPAQLPEAPAGFSIEQVRDTGMLDTWKQASAAGFGGDVGIYYDAYERHGYGDDAYSLHYLGYHNGNVVISSTLLLAGGIAGIYDLSTPPAHRRKGFGGAITVAMMREAARRGYNDCWLWASPMGRSVYARVGFVAVDLGVREYQWRSAAPASAQDSAS